MNEKNNSSGTLRISRDVLATIARAAATEVEGVNCIASAPVDLKGMFYTGQLPRSVSVSLNDELAQVELHVVLNNGVRIPVVSENIQKAVKESIQSMTGVAVSKVNIVIDGIEFKPAEAPQA